MRTGHVAATTSVALVCAALIVPVSALQDPQYPGLVHRGNAVMGFDQLKTTHHFYLYEDGGAIDVSVKDLSDTANRDAIRSHLPHVAMLFNQGDFDAPMLVHANIGYSHDPETSIDATLWGIAAEAPVSARSPPGETFPDPLAAHGSSPHPGGAATRRSPSCRY